MSDRDQPRAALTSARNAVAPILLILAIGFGSHFATKASTTPAKLEEASREANPGPTRGRFHEESVLRSSAAEVVENLGPTRLSHLLRVGPPAPPAQATKGVR